MEVIYFLPVKSPGAWWREHAMTLENRAKLHESRKRGLEKKVL
jgi:hypothetical protein